ncbi:MAG: phospholipase D-like domain-containing protein, partial [Thermomicrobiales bacterium]
IQGLGKADRRSVRVRLIVNAPTTDDGRKAIAQLTAAGIDVSISTRLYIHAKLMIVDDKTAIVGSQNFTPTSLDANREIAMQLAGGLAVVRCVAIFEADWNAARPVANRVPAILFWSHGRAFPLPLSMPAV